MFMAWSGDRLREAREKKNLKQTQVRDRTGINNKTLSGYENSVSEPDLETLKTLAELYEVSVDWLTYATDDPTPPSHKDQSPSEYKDSNPRMGLAFITGGEDLSEEEAEYLKESLELYRRMKERKAKERDGK
ncbi:helix-turn-helix transcriptional regulator [Brevibacillus sp. HD1.4A]|nr:helix-turn-helix transcriptional regulator [Brevibacillus sp. HD1.4A]